MSDRMRKSIIPSKGLQNAAGENNCFLNSAVQLFENIKKASKKAAAEEKVCRMKTGGGSCETVLDLETEKVLAILGNRARPLVNMFDGDAEYNGDSVFQYQPDIFHLDTVDDAPFGVMQPTELTAMSDGAGASIITVHTVVLWHLDVFRQNFRLLTNHACVGRSCIFCGLKVIFTSFEFSDEKSLPPLALRSALAKAFEAAQRFQMGAMDDAAECFESILTGLHTNIAYGHDVDTCNQRHCLTHEKFAMKQTELIVCECGARSKLSETVQLVHYIPTTSLVDQVSDADMSFGQKLKHGYTRGDRLKSCPANCGRNAITHRYLSNAPDVISIGFIWTNDSPEVSHIRNFVLTIEPLLMLSDLFECEHTNSVRLKLVGIVCYYGKHYSTFFFHSRTEKWISFDDESVKEIGAEWDDVIEKVVRGRYQPLLLLYQNLNHQHIPTATAFKKTFEITPSDLNGSKPKSSHNANNNSNASGLKVLRAPFVPSSSAAVNSGTGQYGSRITACSGAPVLASPTTSGFPCWPPPAGIHSNTDLLSTRTNSVVRHSTQPLIPLTNPAGQPSQPQFAHGGITGWHANSQIPPNNNQPLLNYTPVGAGVMRYGTPMMNPPLMPRYVVPVQAYPISNPPPMASQFSSSALRPVLNNNNSYNGFRQPEMPAPNRPSLLPPQQTNLVPGGGGYPVTTFQSVPSSFQPQNQMPPSTQFSYSQSQQPPAHPVYLMNNFPPGQFPFQSPQLPPSRFLHVQNQASVPQMPPSLPEPLIPVSQPLPAQPFRQSFVPVLSGSAGPSAVVRPAFDPANAGLSSFVCNNSVTVEPLAVTAVDSDSVVSLESHSDSTSLPVLNVSRDTMLSDADLLLLADALKEECVALNATASEISEASVGETEDGLSDWSLVESGSPDSCADIDALPELLETAGDGQKSSPLMVFSSDSSVVSRGSSDGDDGAATTSGSSSRSGPFTIIGKAQSCIAATGTAIDSSINGLKEDILQKADYLMTLCAIKEKGGDLHAALLCCNQATLLYKQAVQRLESSNIPSSDLENIRVKSNVTFLESRRLYNAIQTQYGANRAAGNAKRSPGGASKTESVPKVTAAEIDSRTKEQLQKNPVELPDISEINLDSAIDAAGSAKDNLIQLDETVPDVRQMVLKEQVNHLYGRPARLGAVRIHRTDPASSRVPTVTAFLQQYGCLQPVGASKSNGGASPSTNLPSSMPSQTSSNGPPSSATKSSR